MNAPFPAQRSAASRAILASLATAWIVLGVASSAIAVDDPADPPPVSFAVTYLTSGAIRPGGTIGIGVSASATGSVPVTDLSVSVSLTTEPLADRGLLTPWEKGDIAPPSREVARTALGGPDGVLPRETEYVSVSLSASTLEFTPGTVEVYGMTVTLEQHGSALSEIRTFVTWLDGEPSVVPVSLLVLASGSTERVDALLDTAGRPEVAFAVDPMLLSPSAISHLASLDTYLLPAYNVDLSSVARAGSSGVLDRSLARARAQAPLSLASAPWLGVSANVDQPVVTLASDRRAAALIPLPAFTTTPMDVSFDGPFPPALALTSGNGTSIPVFLPDAGLSAALISGPPGSTTTPARMTAETALLSSANSSNTPVLVVAGPSWTIESDHRSGTLSALVDSPWVQLTRIASVLDLASPGTIALPASAPSTTDIPVSLLTQVGSSLRGLDALAACASDPSALSDSPTALILGSLSFDKRTDPTTRDASIQDALSVVSGLTSSVSIPGSSTLNLIGKSGNVPVTVTNDLDVDVTVTVILESRSPILVIEEHPRVTVPARTSHQVLVPITAVSSGNVGVRVGLANDDGIRLTPPTEFSLRIRAEWGDLFTAIVAALGLTLLIAGVVRTIRRGRADTRQGPTPEPDEEPL